MKTEQSERLWALLEHARHSTVRYANLLPRSIGPDPFKLLKQLPPLSKQDVRREKARLYSTAGDTSSWRVASTTGTTGEPVEVVLDRQARECEMSVLEHHFDKCVGPREWRARNVMHLVMHAGAASHAAPSFWNSAARIIKWNLLRAWQSSDAQFLKSLEHINGNLVTVMPSVVQLLCARLSDAGSRIKPLLVLLSGETVEPEVVAAVSKVLDCPVTSLYTTTEAGIIGRPCGVVNGYHVEERNVFLEILNEDAQPVEASREGELVVTPLENYAMPLIRYRTGDRGLWREEGCSCSDPAPRFELTTSRRPARLVTASGVAVNIVRFAKIFASFDLHRYSVHQRDDGAVTVSYLANHQLDGASASVMAAAVRAVVGPDAGVSIRRVSSPAELNEQPSGQDNGDRDEGHWSSFEPDGPDLADLSCWLRDRLSRERGIECAILTGSALNPDATTRFSDIDLVLFLREDESDPRWTSLARQLRQSVPKLAVNVDRLVDLARRAPLFTCRLLNEHLPVLGRLDRDALRWPSQNDLRREGRLWAQQAAAALWHQLTSPEGKAVDPIREAWVSAKYGLNALRYRYLVSGKVETAPLAVIERALLERESLPWLDDLIESFDIAREHRPPPPSTPENSRLYFAAAWFCVHSTAVEFLNHD